MIDIERWHYDYEYIEGAISKGMDPGKAEEIRVADKEYKIALRELENKRAEHNAVNKEIPLLGGEEREGKIQESAKMKTKISSMELKERAAHNRVVYLLSDCPNPADKRVPVGNKDDFEIIKCVGGETPAKLYDHEETGRRLGIVNQEKAVAISGTRFSYLIGKAAQLELALTQWVSGILLSKGFTPIFPPVMVNRKIMEEAGFEPNDKNSVYKIEGSDLYLTGTSEIGLAGLHRGDIIPEESLPLRYAGFSTCFRKEAGSHGRDTRGIFRVHQFDKIEMFSFCTPESSWDELERILGIQEEIVDALGFPYRIINIASEDLGLPAAMKYDIEAWMPSEQQYREITSCSNYTDYSARKMKTRYESDGVKQLVHTLNGTACPIQRTLVFIMENCQARDGSIVVPNVLQDLCGFNTIEITE